MSGKKISKKANWFKENNFTPEDKIYVGVDVHKQHYNVAIWHNGRIGCAYSMSSDDKRLLRDMQKVSNSLKNIVYEAGPTGYSLVRLLRSANLPAEVVATTKAPRMSDSSAKTDRLDCQQLAEYAAKDLLSFVAVPTENQEADRQVLRLRDQLVSKRKRIMQQVKSLLLQHGISWPGGNWNKTLIKKLRQLNINDELRFTVNQYLDEYEFFCNKIADTEAKLSKVFSSEEHIAAVKIFKSHPGVGDIVAWSIVLRFLI